MNKEATTFLSNWLLCFGLFLVCIQTHAQEANLAGEIKTIESFILNDELDEADVVLQNNLQAKKTNARYKEASKLVYWQGKIEMSKNDAKVFPKALDLYRFIEKQTKDPFSNYQINLDLSRLYNESGDMAKALEVSKKALSFAQKSGSKEALTTAHYYLGEYSLRSGNINPFFENIEKGHRILLDNPDQQFKIAARILNYMGAIKYFTSKPDSAYYYYDQALLKVGEMEDNTENRLYFPAAIKANMVLLKQSQNAFEEAMSLAEECILLNKRFLNSSKKHPLRFRSQRNLSLAYRNLASLYEQIVDYDKSHQIATIAYEHGKANFEPNLLEYFSAVTLLAESKNLIREFDDALDVLQEAKESLDSMDGEIPLLRANYHAIMGNAYYGKKHYLNAKKEYENSDVFFTESQGTTFSSDRLFAQMNLALSNAKLGNKESAFNLLDRAYEFQSKQPQTSNRLVESLLIAKARSAEILEDYPTVINTVERFFQMHTDAIANKASEVYKTEAQMLGIKAKYHLQLNKDVSFLKSIDEELKSTIALLEKRKPFLESKENINALITENIEVFEFAKKINLELYEKTDEITYLEKLVALHESSIYTRIRTRLNLSEDIRFMNLPKGIQEREKEVQEKLKTTTSDISVFLKAIKEWDQLLDSIKTRFPEYYEMRYSTLFQPLKQLQNKIPNETTVIRYIFIEEKLYAYVADGINQSLISLSDFDKSEISSFNSTAWDLASFNQTNQRLFQTVWSPLTKQIKTKKVIIYPDQSLFNLSFELLSPDKINSFKELATKSLLANYDISYNYSLLLLSNQDRMLEFEEDFVGYAPEFNSSMKDDYEMTISDSLFLDKTYLRLLPQPFSSKLASKYGKRFKGKSFLNENASKQVFSASANEHKIIHIGTHAESNNISPELSRLVFAKNVADSVNINDNYLYTYEIYNQNLNSNLAILTACETGKPTYQPGEGMISLAHAFNYAGSESILTSLWQIDEKSSTQILEFFYSYLEEGKRKDEALRLAKLDYLKNAEGRTVHPQYWAGLVLMGDTTPINLNSGVPWWVWVILALLALGLTTLLIKGKRKSVK